MKKIIFILLSLLVGFYGIANAADSNFGTLSEKYSDMSEEELEKEMALWLLDSILESIEKNAGKPSVTEITGKVTFNGVEYDLNDPIITSFDPEGGRDENFNRKGTITIDGVVYNLSDPAIKLGSYSISNSGNITLDGVKYALNDPALPGIVESKRQQILTGTTDNTPKANLGGTNSNAGDVENQVEVIATTNNNVLPTTGPEHILIIFFALITGFGIFIMQQKKSL